MRTYTCIDCEAVVTINHGGKLPTRCRDCQAIRDRTLHRERMRRYSRRNGIPARTPVEADPDRKRRRLERILHEHGLTWKEETDNDV